MTVVISPGAPGEHIHTKKNFSRILLKYVWCTDHSPGAPGEQQHNKYNFSRILLPWKIDVLAALPIVSRR